MNFEDGFYVRKVVSIKKDQVKVDYRHPKKISTVEEALERQFWVWPQRVDKMMTEKDCVLPIYPVLTVAAPPSTSKCVVFNLENVELVQKLAE